MGGEVVGENDPFQENEETVHEIKDKTGTDEEEIESIHELVRGDDPSLGSVETVEDEKKSRFRTLEPNPSNN